MGRLFAGLSTFARGEGEGDAKLPALMAWRCSTEMQPLPSYLDSASGPSAPIRAARSPLHQSPSRSVPGPSLAVRALTTAPSLPSPFPSRRRLLPPPGPPSGRAGSRPRYRTTASVPCSHADRPKARRARARAAPPWRAMVARAPAAQRAEFFIRARLASGWRAGAGDRLAAGAPPSGTPHRAAPSAPGAHRASRDRNRIKTDVRWRNSGKWQPIEAGGRTGQMLGKVDGSGSSQIIGDTVHQSSVARKGRGRSRTGCRRGRRGDAAAQAGRVASN